jgi:hypothetical protein
MDYIRTKSLVPVTIAVPRPPSIANEIVFYVKELHNNKCRIVIRNADHPAPFTDRVVDLEAVAGFVESITSHIMHARFVNLRNGFAPYKFNKKKFIEIVEIEGCTIDLTCKSFMWPTRDLILSECNLSGTFTKNPERKIYLRRLLLDNTWTTENDKAFCEFFDGVVTAMCPFQLAPTRSLIAPGYQNHAMRLNFMEEYMDTHPLCIAIPVEITNESEMELFLEFASKYERMHAVQSLLINNDQTLPTWLKYKQLHIRKTFAQTTPFGPVPLTGRSFEEWENQAFKQMLLTL